MCLLLVHGIYPQLSTRWQAYLYYYLGKNFAHNEISRGGPGSKIALENEIPCQPFNSDCGIISIFVFFLAAYSMLRFSLVFLTYSANITMELLPSRYRWANRLQVEESAS